MKNKYLKLMLVLLITFPSLFGCRAVKPLIKLFRGIDPGIVKGTDEITDFAKGVGKGLKTLDPNQISKFKKTIKAAAYLNITEEAINNGNKISRQKVERHIADEIEREMKRMKRTLNRTLNGTQKQQIEEEVEKEVEKDLEENGITITAY
ncbi:hypothetical protein [Dapis sp. BLCC M172]|uniref:hypothetical protein n=1 Tax=Dapis sp. BLCC M172 TaxID=2975281 RepID=UPI003CF20341